MSSLAASERTTKYDIPLGHLDYAYVRDCSDAKELEKIIRTLRAGDEGSYPDLEKFAETRLAEIKPKSKVLWKSKPISMRCDVEKAEWEEIMGDLENWRSDMSSADQSLKQQAGGQAGESTLPPVRGQAKVITTNKNSSSASSSGKASQKKKVKPREYNEWDKFDIDAELSKVEGKEPKKEQKAGNVLRKSSAPPISATVDSTGMTEEEILKRTNLEKDKGNEAFRANDFAEALLYYNRSISLKPTVAAHNNRAQTHVKLKLWNMALDDCQVVLKLEPNNLKALLRRAVAYQGRNELVNAKNDIQRVLKAEPQNNRAKGILDEINKSLTEQKVKGRRMVIDEVEGSSDGEDGEAKDPCLNASRGSGDQKKSMVNGLVDSDVPANKSKTLDQPLHNQSSPVRGKSKTKESIDTRTDTKSEKSNSVTKTESSTTVGNPAGLESSPSAQMDPHKSDKTKQGGNPSSTTHKASGKSGKRRKKGKAQAKINTQRNEPEPVCENVAAETPPVTATSQVGAAENAANTTHSGKLHVKSSISEKQSLGPAKHHAQSVSGCKPANPPSGNVEAAEPPAEQAVIPTEVPAPVVSDPPPPPLPSEVTDLKAAGNHLFKVGQYGEAVTQYGKALDTLSQKEKTHHKVDVSVLYSNRAACKLKLGDCEGAIRDCNAALDLVPGLIKPLVRRAQAYETMEKFRKAYTDYRQALYVDSQVDVALQGVNRCMKMLQEMDGPRWREKLPKVTIPTCSTPVYSATSASDHHTVTTPAPPTSAPPTSAPPTSATPTSATPTSATPSLSPDEIYEKCKIEGNKFVQKADFSAAVSCYTQCIEAVADRSVAYTNRALCYLRLNKPRDVLKDCNKALELESGNLKALFRRAQAYKMLERYDESFFDLATLLKKDPKNSAARREFQVVIGYREEAKKAKQAGEKSPVKEKKERQRLKIQEVEDSSEDEETELVTKKAEPKQDTETAPTSDVPEVKTHPKGESQRHPEPKKTQATKKVTKETPTASEKEKLAASPRKDADVARSDAPGGRLKDPMTDAKVTQPEKTSPTLETKQEAGFAVGKLVNKTPYEFIQAWSSLRAVKGPESYVKLLEQIEPEELPKVISNKLDGDMLHKIIQCVELFIDREQLSSGVTLNAPSDLVTMPTGMSSRSLAYLQQLTTVPRFKTITMFMGDEEKKDLKRVLDKLAAQGTCRYLQQDLRKLRKAYEV